MPATPTAGHPVAADRAPAAVAIPASESHAPDVARSDGNGASHEAWEAHDPEPRSSLARLARHLIDVRLVSAADVHLFGLVARDAGMSHAVAVVTLGDGRGFVVKELLRPSDDNQGTPDQERAVYRLAAGHDVLREFVAPVVHLGDGSPFLVLDLRADGETVASRAARTGWSDGQLAIHLGSAIGAWHERSRPFRADLPLTRVPWILRALDPDRPSFLRSNGFVAGLLDTVPVTSLRPALVETQGLWRSSGVVHGDLRFDNCLVGPTGRITFVDWESGGHGDPVWDLATLAQELISASTARDAASCVPVLSGAVRLLLESYRAACPSESWRPDGSERLVRFTAARLLQRAFQLAARGSPEVAPERDRHVELSAVLFGDPALAPHLAGTPTGAAA
jgi:aminoglycoside phosphotransferase (APT) family kinase protein